MYVPPGGFATPSPTMVKTLKALQDVLGSHQDREVQAAMLRALAADVPRPETLLAMGALVQRLAADEVEAREEFAARFDVFASRKQRRLVKETFA